jgi:hypothetical protein
MGAEDEQYQEPGTGDGIERPYLQLSLFPTEQEQQADIIKTAADDHSVKPSAVFISDDMVDAVLRTGSGKRNSQYHLAAKLLEWIGPYDLARWMETEYGTGGKGFTIEQKKISVWFDEKGLSFARGTSAKKYPDRIVSWDEAASRIRAMYNNRNFLPKVIMDHAMEVERREAANDVALLFSEARVERYSPESKEKLEEDFADKQKLWDVFDRVCTIGANVQADPDQYRFPGLIKKTQKRCHDRLMGMLNQYDEELELKSSLGQLPDNLTPWIEGEMVTYRITQRDMIGIPEISFITQDEIDLVLKKAGNL